MAFVSVRSTVLTLVATAALLLASMALPAVAQQHEYYDEIRYVHTDIFGSVVALTDEQGNVVERFKYEPYGNLRDQAPRNGPGFTGHVGDGATGHVYMQQRYYSPEEMRGLSVDPVTIHGRGDLRHFNRYAYGYNNPYRYVDPDGRQSRDFNWVSREAGTYLKTPGGNGPNLITWGVAEVLCGFCDLNYVAPNGSGALHPIVTPMETSIASGAVRGAAAIANASRGTTQLFRAVGPAELSDINATAALRNLGSAEGKYFTTSGAQASAYAKQAVNAFGDSPYTIIRVDVRNSIFSGLSPVTVDKGIPAWVIPSERLPGLVPQVMNHSPIPPPGF